jgi:hypothetical protein
MASKRPTKYLRDEQRHRLLFGPYSPPAIKRGYLVDVVRGKLPFSHFSNGRIPWPIAKKPGPHGSGGFILCGDLVRALNSESGPAIAYHWGVSPATVTNWKTAVGAPALTKGAAELAKIGRSLARLPEVRSRMSKAARKVRLSNPRKKELMLGSKNRHRKLASERRKAFRQTGRFPRAAAKTPWITEEEKFLGTQPVAHLAQLLGRTQNAIIARHSFRKIPVVLPPRHPHWTTAQLELLGLAPDSEVAASIGRSVEAVQSMRRKRRAFLRKAFGSEINARSSQRKKE